MSYEYYAAIYQQKMAEYDALESQLEANIKTNLSQGGSPAEDSDNMQALANVHAARQALHNYAREQVARAQPYVPPPISPEQEVARPIENWNDTWNMISKDATPSEREAMIPGFQRAMAYVRNGGTR